MALVLDHEKNIIKTKMDDFRMNIVPHNNECSFVLDKSELDEINHKEFYLSRENEKWIVDRFGAKLNDEDFQEITSHMYPHAFDDDEVYITL